MRRAIGAIAALVLVASQASAFTFRPGLNNGSFVDFSSTFTSGQQAGRENYVASNSPPAVGDEVRTIFWMDALKQDGGVVYNSGTNPELTGLIYDLECLAIQENGAFKTYLYGAAGTYASSSGYTGRMDVYADSSNNRNGLTPSTPSNPADWSAISAGNDGSGRDQFATYSDGTWLFSATFLPLVDPTTGEALQVGGQDVLFVRTVGPGGMGYSQYAHLNVVDNPTGQLIVPTNWLDGYTATGDPLRYRSDLRLFANYAANDVGNGNLWPDKSQDPVEFKVIPEPTTMALLGSALVGLIPAIRRRRK